jgi:hypothetical protein
MREQKKNKKPSERPSRNTLLFRSWGKTLLQVLAGAAHDGVDAAIFALWFCAMGIFFLR